MVLLCHSVFWLVFANTGIMPSSVQKVEDLETCLKNVTRFRSLSLSHVVNIAYRCFAIIYCCTLM